MPYSKPFTKGHLERALTISRTFIGNIEMKFALKHNYCETDIGKPYDIMKLGIIKIYHKKMEQIIKAELNSKTKIVSLDALAVSVVSRESPISELLTGYQISIDTVNCKTRRTLECVRS